MAYSLPMAIVLARGEIPDHFGVNFTINDRMNARYDAHTMDLWLESRDAASSGDESM